MGSCHHCTRWERAALVSQFTHRQHILLRIVQLLMRLRTLRQQQLEDRTEQDNLNHVESAAVDDVVSTHPVPFAWRQYSILDRHITSLVAPSLLSASRLSFIDPSVPVSLDSLQARLYGSSQLLRWTYPALDIDNSDGQFPLLAPAACPYVSACRFDRLGSLLACASSSGRLMVLDMDVALAQPLRQPVRPVCAEAARSYNIPKSDCFRVDCLRWEPGSDDCIVVSSGQHADMLRFDLNHGSDQPTSRSTLPSTAGRHLSTAASSIVDFSFLPCHPQLLIAATGEGALQWWDMRAGRVRNPTVAHPTGSRLPCGLSASATLPLVYVWRADASMDVYDVRRLPADRRREVHAWRLVDGGLNRVKTVEPDGHSEARFVLETEGGGVSVFDVWQGRCTTVAGKQRWSGDMATVGSRRRRMAWMNGLGGGDGDRMQRGCTRVVAHATGGPEVTFSRVPLHSRGHFRASSPITASLSAEKMEESKIDDDLPDDDSIDWSDDDDNSQDTPPPDDTHRTQTTLHSYYQPFTPKLPKQQLVISPPPSYKPATTTASHRCACCSHVVGRVAVGGGGVSVMDSHPTLDVLVCGLVSNGLALIAASEVSDEDEERVESGTAVV